MVWPHTGWRRAFAYYLKRLTRLTGTPHNIAAGFACGAAISFTPFLGLHILLGGLLALIVRGNLLAVVVGTLIGNPWTFPFIWFATYEVGLFLLGGHGGATPPVPWTFEDLAHYFGEATRQVSISGPVAAARRLVADLSTVVWPMTVGGLPLGLLAGIATYVPMVRAVAAYQEARRRRRERKRQRAEQAGIGAAGAPTDAGAA